MFAIQESVMTYRGQPTILHAGTQETRWPVLVCVLGHFRLLKAGQPVPVRSGGKTEAFLCSLALRPDDPIPRDTLLCTLWPDTHPNLATQCLNSLVYGLRKLLSDEIQGAAPVVHENGYYGLNVEAGVGVDVMGFDALADAGDHQAQAGNQAAAAAVYRQALQLYRGDLCTGTDVHAVIERERLRARYLTLLAHLADYHFDEGDYMACLGYTRRLLEKDPSREDAHRLVMRCYVRQGERARALRHYGLCQEVLGMEFGAVPEPATRALFDQVRLDPGSI